MTPYQYKVIPAPTRGQKGKGVKGNDGKFAHALEQVMNDMGAEGWEYQRAETLPSEERSGLTSKTTTFRNVLVFRRPLQVEAAPFEPKLLDAPEPEAETSEPDAPDTAPDEFEADENEERDLTDPLKMRADQLSKSEA